MFKCQIMGFWQNIMVQFYAVSHHKLIQLALQSSMMELFSAKVKYVEKSSQLMIESYSRLLNATQSSD